MGDSGFNGVRGRNSRLCLTGPTAVRNSVKTAAPGDYFGEIGVLFHLSHARQRQGFAAIRRLYGAGVS